jgi:predicted protein tyrosine phosphatase
MRLLFVCNQGRHRSRTAAELLSKEHETRYRGIYDNPLTAEDLTWADAVFVMEDHQRQEIAERFPKEYLRARIITLGVPDAYSYGQPELIAVLRKRINESLQSIHAVS